MPHDFMVYLKNSSRRRPVWLMYNNVLMGRHIPIVRDKVPRLFIPVVIATAARALEVGRGSGEEKTELW